MMPPYKSTLTILCLQVNTHFNSWYWLNSQKAGALWSDGTFRETKGDRIKVLITIWESVIYYVNVNVAET